MVDKNNLLSKDIIEIKDNIIKCNSTLDIVFFDKLAYVGSYNAFELDVLRISYVFLIPQQKPNSLYNVYLIFGVEYNEDLSVNLEWKYSDLFIFNSKTGETPDLTLIDRAVRDLGRFGIGFNKLYGLHFFYDEKEFLNEITTHYSIPHKR